MKSIIVGQSGGPTAVINASLYGVITQAAKSSPQSPVYGMENGIEGFLKGHVIDLKAMDEEQLHLLKTTPGAYLGSCRYKLPEDLSDPIYSQLFEQFRQFNIGYFFYIGGNDSMDTVNKLARYAKQIHFDICIVGIPKTIDNDLVLTDHTPGYGSAARYVASMVRSIARDASVYDTKSVTIVEIMGRHAGWLTAASALARQTPQDNPVLIYLPERDFDESAFLLAIEEKLKEKKNLIICVSEGIHDANGQFVCEHNADMLIDTFGHKILTGCGKYLENLIRQKMSIKVRSVELNVTQRCACSDLSAADVEEAVAAGSFGVTTALSGRTGFMCALKRATQNPYSIVAEAVDVADVCNLEKKVPLSWITKDGTDITQDFIDYAMPLIRGDVVIPKKDSLPVFAYRNPSPNYVRPNK